jgi:hypothetical protein
MKKTLIGNSRRLGVLLNDIDLNFTELAGALLKLTAPELTLLGYAEPGGEPAAPEPDDCWLIQQDAAELWSLEDVEKDQLIRRTDSDEWEILPFKITELNEVLQENFFAAEKIKIEPIPGMSASTVQEAIEELYTMLSPT